MNLILNELSIYPIAENSAIAEARLKQFILTLKSAKKRYNFKHIEFPQDYANLQLVKNKSFYEFISKLPDHDMKDVILGICTQPYIDDNLKEQELNLFVNSIYTIPDKNVPTTLNPMGLPIAFIKSLLAISFDSHYFWKNRKISIRKIGGENIDDVTYNISAEDDMDSIEISEWADKSITVIIDSEHMLKCYLGFTKYSVLFDNTFLKQLFEWKNQNFDLFKRILYLMKEVQEYPFSGGMGQTENLKNRGKQASKRITQSDRLSYILENDVVTFIACKGHYEFH